MAILNLEAAVRNVVGTDVQAWDAQLYDIAALAVTKGNVIVAGRKSPYSLYLKDLASFGASSYDHGDATGFINLFGLATGVAAIVHRGIDEDTGQTPEIKGMAGFHEK